MVWCGVCPFCGFLIEFHINLDARDPMHQPT
jgi:hypothetical protein